MSKTKLTSTRFLIPKTIKCVNPEVAERVDALDQSLQKVLRKETSIINNAFFEILFPHSLENNICFGRDGIHLSFNGTNCLQMTYRNTLETT